MKLIRLTAGNFGSHEKIQLDFKGGLTLVDGWNHDLDSANGAGKSVMLNSIVFAIYGKTVKKLNLQDLIRSGQTNMFTAIELETKAGNINIYRSRGPNHVKLYINGEMFDGTSAKVEARINEVLDLTYEQFVQVCYRYQKARDRFIELNDTAKKDFLTSILALDRYSVAYKNTHGKLADLEKKLANLDGQRIGYASRLASDTEALRFANDALEKLAAQKQQVQKDFDRRVFNFNASRADRWLTAQKEWEEYWVVAREESDRLLANRHRLSAEIRVEEEARDISQRAIAGSVREWGEKRADLAAKLKKAQQVMYSAGDYERQIERLKTEQGALWRAREWRVEENCSKCGQRMPEADPGPERRHVKEYDAKIKVNDEQRAELKAKLEKAAKITLTVCDEIERQFAHAAKEAVRIQAEGVQKFDLRIAELRKEDSVNEHAIMDLAGAKVRATEKRDRVDSDLKNEESKLLQEQDLNVASAKRALEQMLINVERLGKSAEESNLKLCEIDVEIVKVREDALYLAEAKKLFSPTGVRAFIFDGIVTSLNQRIDRYLQVFFNGAMKFEYVSDEETGKFTESLTYGMKYVVGQLSGGEEARLSMAIDLALSDVIASRLSVQPNLLILDEAADGMDAIGREQLMTLLQELEKTRDVIFVVDHHSEFKTNFSKVIRLELRNEVTSRV